MNIADQIQQVRLNIAEYCSESERNGNDVHLLAVSKTHPATAIQQAYEAGLTEFGESYLQEAIEKIKILDNPALIWHFIGPIQSNKTRPIAEHFHWVHSVDRAKLLIRLNEQRPKAQPPINVCIQLNLFEEPQKKGATPSELPQLLELADSLPQITLRGIMVIPPAQNDFNNQMRQFKQVESCFEKHRANYASMDTLSMGMSGDIRAAIHCGSNMVRVGTGIFGPRKSNII